MINNTTVVKKQKLVKSFLYAEKKTKRCACIFQYLLIFLVTVWMTCVVVYHGHQSSKETTILHDAGKVESSDVNGENNYSSSDDNDIHIVFSTDCSTFQDWQTLLLFHSASVVRQPGVITRVASGCPENKKKELVELYNVLYPSSYRVHFTPDYKLDAKTKKKYDFYNKPFGVLHWLEHSVPPLKSGTIIALIDPDFIFLRPLSPRMAGQDNTLVSNGVSLNDVFERAGRNRPVAQFYGLGAPWARKQNEELNRTKICGTGSPCLKVPNERIGAQHYSVGAPYILEKSDFLRLTKTWVDFVPRVYEDFPDLLAEMFAYAMAAAHQQLPHLRMNHFMVSNVDVNDEGWPWIDALGDEVATPPNDNGIFFPGKPLPTFVHYCQFYRAAKIGFQKRRVFRDIFSCHKGLFVDLPEGLSLVNHKEREGGEIVPQTSRQVKRSTFMLSILHKAFNSALVDYKMKIYLKIQNISNTNFNKTINLAEVKY